MTLLGTIVEHAGMICLETHKNTWYPLDGASGIAEDFREAFGTVQRGDIGKQVHYGPRRVLQMENAEQRDLRLVMTVAPEFTGQNVCIDRERYRK